MGRSCIGNGLGPSTPRYWTRLTLTKQVRDGQELKKLVGPERYTLLMAFLPLTSAISGNVRDLSGGFNGLVMS